MLNVLPGRLGSRRALRIEALDNYHEKWNQFLAFVGESAQPGQLQLDQDGWLSARQVVLAGFVDDEIVGFVAFSVVPKIDENGVSVEAHLDAVVAGFESEWVETSLLESASARALALKCGRMLQRAA